jgi:hypothetical protein
MIQVSMSEHDVFDRRKSSLLSSGFGPPRNDPVLIQIGLVRSRVIGSFSNHSSFVFLLFLFRILFEGILGVDGFEMGFSRTGIQAEAIEVSEEYVDILVGSVRGRGIDEHDRCEWVGRWLEEIGIRSLESHHSWVLAKDTSHMSGELVC